MYLLQRTWNQHYPLVSIILFLSFFIRFCIWHQKKVTLRRQSLLNFHNDQEICIANKFNFSQCVHQQPRLILTFWWKAKKRNAINFLWKKGGAKNICNIISGFCTLYLSEGKTLLKEEAGKFKFKLVGKRTVGEEI